jgi:hypothetical protein
MALQARSEPSHMVAVSLTCPSWLELDCSNPNLRACQDATPGNVVDYRVQPMNEGSELEPTLASATPYICGSCKTASAGDCHRQGQGDEWETYQGLECATCADHGIPYGGRPLWVRSRRSSPKSGKPTTWRRAAGVHQRMPSRINARCVGTKGRSGWALESRMQGNLHVRFGEGPLEKGSLIGPPRWGPIPPYEGRGTKKRRRGSKSERGGG